MWGGDDPTRSAECGHAVERNKTLRSQQVTMIMREHCQGAPYLWKMDFRVQVVLCGRRTLQHYAILQSIQSVELYQGSRRLTHFPCTCRSCIQCGARRCHGSKASYSSKKTAFICEDHLGTTVVIRGSVPSA